MHQEIGNTIVSDAATFSPYTVLYDPMKYVQLEPLELHTPDFDVVIKYKISEEVLHHDFGHGNLRQYVKDLINDDFELYNIEKPSQDPTNIVSKETSGIDETFVCVTVYKYPSMKVTVTKYTSDAI